MKKISLMLLSVLFLSGILSTQSVAQTKITIIVNTATISDTITAATSKLTVTGSAAAITSWSDGIAMTNIGGDYWKTTVTFITGDTVKFKFRANGGWEDGGDHTLIVGKADSTLPLSFYNASGGAKADYAKPWTATPDSMFNVWVRVNMKAVQDNNAFSWTAKDKDSVAVRGDGKGGNDLDWGISYYLTQEKDPAFFSGRLRFPKNQFAVGYVVNYKFLLGWNWGRDELGGKPNRTFPVPQGQKDTTLAYVYFNDEKPIVRENSDTCIITFNVDMKTATNTKGFAQGDTVAVETGYFKTGLVDAKRKLLKLSIGTTYSVTDTVVTSVGKILDYQYYLIKNATDVREYYYNFDYAGTPGASEQERRQVVVASKKFTVADVTVGNDIPRRQPRFPSQIPLKQAVKVKWVLDMRPAYAQIKAGTVLKGGQGTNDVAIADSIKPWGVGMNGGATNLPTVYPVGDWAPWDAVSLVSDTCKRKMWDNGTHGDLKANDTLYTVEFTYPLGSNAGKISKYGIKGGDNETGFGLNHLDNVDDANTTATLNVAWGSINPKLYSAWNYNNVTAVGTTGEVLPTQYALDQNYPNPFNPATKIQFALPAQTNVKLSVFNVVGQEVATLLNTTMPAGVHVVSFDASKLSSGVYFYRIAAGKFTSIKKMMLMK